MEELKDLAVRLKKAKEMEQEKLQALRERVIEVGRRICDTAYILRIRPSVRYRKTPYVLRIVGNKGFRWMLQGKSPEEQIKISRRQIFRYDDVSPVRRLKPGVQPFRGYFLLLIREGMWKAQISANSEAVNERFRMVPEDNPLGWPHVPVAGYIDLDRTIYVRIYHAPDNIQDLTITKDHPEWSTVLQEMKRWPFKRIHEPGFDWEIRKHINRLSVNLLQLVLDAYPLLVEEIYKEVEKKVDKIAKMGARAEQLAASLERLQEALKGS